MHSLQAYKGWAYAGVSVAFLGLAFRGESRLRKTADYQSIFEHTLEGFFQSTPAGKLLTVNPAMARIFGYKSPEEMLSLVTNISEQLYVSPADRQRLLESLEQQETIEGFEAQVRRKDGSLFWSSMNARSIRGSKAELLYMEGFLQDISERKRSEQVLVDSEGSLRGLYQNNPLMLVTLAQDGRILSANRTAEEVTEYSEQELLGRRAVDLIYAEDRAGAGKQIEATLANQGEITQIQFRAITKSRRRLWLEATARRFIDGHDGVRLYVACKDITESKEAETRLRLAEERFRALVEQMPAAVYTELLNGNGTKVYVNPQIEKIMGYTAEEWMADPSLWKSRLHPEDEEAVLCEDERTNRTLEPYNVEYRALAKDGRLVWLRDQATLVRDSDGTPMYWQGILVDITEQKRIQEVIVQSEERFSKVFEASPIPTCITAWEDGELIDANPAYWALSGYAPEELLGCKLINMDAGGPTRHRQVLKTLEQQRSINGIEDKFATKAGAVLDVSIFHQIIRLNDRECILSMFHDITAQKQAQERLAQSEISYRGLFDTVADAIYIQAPDGMFLDVNEGAARMYGYSREELIGKSPADVAAPGRNDMNAILDKVKRALEGQAQQFEFWGKRRTGEVFPKNVRLAKGLYFGREVVIAFAEDITERKAAEEALRSAEARYRALVENVPAVVYIDAIQDTSTIYMSPQVEALTGYASEEWLADPKFWNKSLHPDDREAALQEVGRTSREGAPFNMEYRLVRRDGRVIWVYDHATLIRNEKGEPLYYQGVLVETTRQREAEEAIRRKEAILNAIAYAADRFLKAPGWATNIGSILERLGQAAAVSRVYIFRMSAEESAHPIATQLFEWCAAHASPQIDNPRLQMFDMTENGLKRWSGLLASGSPVYGIVKELPACERAEFERESILSIICMPILIEGKWWGFIGLDDCNFERTWSESEIEALETAANILGAAIQREQVGDAAQKQLKELVMLHAVALASSTTSGVDELIGSVTDIINNTLQPDNCGILLVDETRRLLLPHRSYRGNVLEELNEKRSIDIGVAGLVVSRRRPLRIGDVRSTPEFVEVSPDIRSELCVPIISGDQVIGVVNLENKQLNAFDEADERLISTIAGGLATSIEKINLFEAEGRRAREAEALREATTALTSSLDLNTLLNTTLDLVAKFAPYDSASIELIDEEMVTVVAGRNIPPALVGKAYTIDRERWGIQDLREPIIIPDVWQDKRFEKWEGTEYIRSWMGIPLYAQDRLIGSLNLDNKLENFYTAEHASIAQTFANQAAIAIQNAHLFESEQQRRREAETLREAVAALASDLRQDQAIHRILEQLAKVVPYRSASVQILADGYLEIVGGAGWEEPACVLGMRFPIPGDNPNTVVIEQRRAHILTNAPSQYTNFSRGPHEHIHSWLGVPLIVRDTVIGMVAIDHSQPDFYTAEHARLAETFANQAALAIANARIFEEEQRRSQIIQALADIANELATNQEMGHLLDRIAQRALELLKASHVAIYLVQNDEQTVKVVSARGTYSKELISHTIKVGVGITGNVIANGTSEIINDTRRDPRTVMVPGTPEEDGQVETMMSAALIVRGKPIGAINAWRLRSNGLFNESELNFLISIAHQTSISIELSRLFQETSRRAREAAAVAEVGRDVSSTLDLDVVLEKIAQYAKDLLNVETSAVYMYDPADTQLHAVAVFGPDAQEIKNDPLTLGRGIVGQIAISKTGEIVNYAASDPRAVTVQGTEVNPVEHIMGVPVLSKEQLTGLLVVWRAGADLEFQPSELNFLASLAQQAAVAIQNARSFAAEQDQRLREASMLDLMKLAASSLDLDEVNQTILGHLIRLIPCGSGTIQLLRGERLYVSAAIGFPQDSIHKGSYLLLDDYPLTSEVVTQKKPLRIADTTFDEWYHWLPGIETTRSVLAIPIIFRDDVIGIATLESSRVGRFTREDEELAVAVANNAANAIGNARLFELEQEGRQEAENLRLAASAMTSSLDPQQVLETILTALRQVVPYDSASIMLLEDDSVRITAANGLPDLEAAIGRAFPASNGLFLAIAENNNQPIILYDAQADPRFERWAAGDTVHGWMGVPLVTRGETTGYITLDSYQPGAFDENSAGLAQTFAYQAAAAIDNARLYQETRRRLEELEVISRVSFALRATQNPNEMLPVLLKEVLKVMDTEAASIWLYDSVSNRLERSMASGQQNETAIQALASSEAVADQVFRTGEVYLIEDLSGAASAETTPTQTTGAGWSAVGVPIRTSTQTIGAMIVAVPVPRKVEPPQLQLLTTLAEIAGNAIHRAQLYDQSEEQVRRLTALRDVDTAIASSFDLRVTLNILLDHTLSQLRADAAAILSYNPDMRTLSHVASLGFHQSSSIQTPLRISSRILSDALLERKDIHIKCLADEPLFHRKELAAQEKFVTYYATPLVSKGQVKGILELYFRRSHSPETDWLEFFQTMAGQAAIAIDNSQLFDNLQRSNQELSLAYDTTLEGWGKALELRDRETQGHTVRVTDLTLRLARRLGIPEADLIHIRRGVLLHDIGKMAVPDHILKKTGPLDEQEWVEMRMHPQYAYELLLPITYLRPALDIPYCHHERWDGQGYPRKLKGEDIPVAARIFAVVDVWDALLYDRPYRAAWPRQDVINYIAAEMGTRFDPHIAGEFLRMVQEEHLKAE